MKKLPITSFDLVAKYGTDINSKIIGIVMQSLKSKFAQDDSLSREEAMRIAENIVAKYG